MNRLFLIGTSIAALAMPAVANASVTIKIYESGNDVIGVATGSLDLADLTLAQTRVASNGIISGNTGVALIGGYASNTVKRFAGLTGPASFGTSGLAQATSSTGIDFGFSMQASSLYIDSGYISNATFTSTSTFANKTIASLGLTSGDYIFTDNHQTITLSIAQSQSAAVPEASTWAMMVGGFGIVGGAMRRRKMIVRFA